MLLLLLGIVFLHVTALVLLAVSTAISAWAVNPASSSDLWTNCTLFDNNGDNGDYLCDWADSGVWIQAVQAVMILSIVFSFLSFILFFCQLFKLQKGGRFFLTGVFQIFSSLFVLSGVIMYTLMNSEWVHPSESYGFSYMLAWVAFPVALISGLIYLLLRKRE